MDISTNSNEVALMISFAFLMAGIVKGVLGIGLPTTAITIMTFFVSPLMALGLNLIPMTVTNIWQFSKADDPRDLIKNYKYFAISLVVFILITSFYANEIGDNVVRLIFAIAVLLFVSLQIFGFSFKMNPKRDSLWQTSLGTLGGIFGGAASIWAVPVTMYLLMKNVKPKQFVDVSGFLIMIGCIPVSIGYIATGVFQPNMFIYGALGSVIGIIGFQIGEKLRNKINAKTFRNLLLVFFSFSAINMIIQSILNFGLFDIANLF